MKINLIFIIILLSCCNNSNSQILQNKLNANYISHYSIPSDFKAGTIVSDFLGKSYIGNYQAKQFSSLFNYLDVSQGSIQLDFLNDPANKTDQKVNTLALELYNPIYHDKKAVLLVVHLQIFDNITSSWKSDSSQISVYKLNKEQEKSSTKCNSSYEVRLQPIDGNFSPKNTLIYLSFIAQSDVQNSCNFKFQATMHYYDYRISAILYCTFVTVLVFIQIIAAYKLINSFINNQIEASKLSLATVAFCNIQDFFLTMMHLYFLMAQDQYYIYFIVPIFMLVLLSVVFDMKLLFIVWRQKYKNQINTPIELRKKLTVFYVKFYFGLFTYLTIMYFFPYQLWSLLLQAFLIVPQIIHNVRKGNNPKFFPYYVFGVLGMRIILPLYYRGCPSNIYVIQPSKIFCILWILFFAIQITILFLQSKIGPRFFIPKCLIPGYYNYQHKFKMNSNQQMQQCPICLESLTANPNQIESIANTNLNQSNLQDNFIKQAIVMKAPCNHMFHPDCLKEWIDVKLQCPTCRAALPPLNL